MDDHLIKINAAAKAHKKQSEQNNDTVDKSENSSSLFKSSSFADSAYSSLGQSAIGSLGSFNNATWNQYPYGKPSGLSSYKSPAALIAHTSHLDTQDSNVLNDDKQFEPLWQRNREKKRALSNSIKDKLNRFKEQDQEEKPSFQSSQETKAATVATLSQALGYVAQFKKSQASKLEKSGRGDEINVLAKNLLEVCQGSKIKSNRGDIKKSLSKQEQIPNNIDESCKNQEGEGFCAAVSLHDGMVIQTTPTLSSVLGYPKDMWIGRSFIDFVHPKDRDVFIAQVTDNMNLPVKDLNESRKQGDNFFCRIRSYNGLKSGFSVKERKTRYKSFKLRLCFSEINTVETSENDSESIPELSNHLFITAIPLQSAYSVPNQEGPIVTKCGKEIFTSKHTAACIFTFVDDNSIAFLGHFPLDIQGMEIFEYIHPNDLPIIKESFEKIMFGKSFKSQPYRLKTRNGDFVNVSTVWSCFINPWSRQLEFIHGKHTVMKGPEHPNIFMDVSPDTMCKLSVSEETAKESLLMKSEIKMILQKTTQRTKLSETIDIDSMKSKQVLSRVMGTMLQEVLTADNIEPSNPAKAATVAISNISPHRPDSSVSPPSYTQLSYNENLTRFFNSQPKTVSEKDMLNGFMYSQESYPPKTYNAKTKEMKKRNCKSGSGHVEDGGRSAGGSGHGSGEQQGSGTGQTVSGSGEDNTKNSSSLQTGLSAGHIQPGGEEWMLSQDGCTSGSGSRLGSGSREGLDDVYRSPVLTEKLMFFHNQEMEKQMITKFKEAKRGGDIRFGKDSGKHIDAQESESKRIVAPKAIVELEIKQEDSVRKSCLKPNVRPNTIPPQVTNNLTHSPCMAGTPPNIHSFSQTQEKEGIFSVNNAPIIQGPSSGDGYQKFIQLPAFYVPIMNPSSAPSLMLPAQIPLGMLLQTHDNKGISKALSRETTKYQPELPNCLAVNSCIAFMQQENLKESTIPNKLIKKRTIRQDSQDGSRHTSVKGEPGSALESIASAGASMKGRNYALRTEPKETEDESSYSYLQFQSSDEHFTDGFIQIDSLSEGSPEECKVISPRLIVKPVLSEPFWNENVILNDALINSYQLEEQTVEDVLRKDKEKLLQIQQPTLVKEQLKELYEELDMDDQHGIDILFAEEEDSDDETTSADESNDDIDDVIESRKRKKKMLYLDKLNIFMEANAPFPMKTSMNLKESSSHPDKNVTIGNISSSIQNENVCDESESAKLQSEFSKNSSTQTIFEAVFEKSLENASCSQRRHEVEYSFSSVRPQNKRFRYGSDSDKISMTEKDKDKAKTNQRNEDPSVELKHEEKESKTPLSENTHDKAFCSSNLRNATQSFAPIRKQENKFRYGSDLCKSNEQMQGGHLKTSSSPVPGLQDSRLKESTDDSESSEEYLITTSSDQNSDDQYKNEKRPQENRFRYGSDLCKSNEQMQRELKINQTRGEKSKDDKKDEGSEKEGLTRKTGHLKTSSSPVPGLQDSRLKESTDDSESSEEYLLTTSSDQNSDDQYKNEKRPQMKRGYFA